MSNNFKDPEMIVHIAQVFVGALRSTAFIGGLAGGSAVAARVYRRRRSGKKIDNVDALRVIGKEAAGTSVAVAAGFTAVSILGRGVFPPFAVAMVAATGAKYLYDKATARL
jgi:fructose-specific phosphotransferase system IIC component